jgi:hypothetical protein
MLGISTTMLEQNELVLVVSGMLQGLMVTLGNEDCTPVFNGLALARLMFICAARGDIARYDNKTTYTQHLIIF